jgi:2,4-dienoyl-CoA reductase-like NADH-dependent reductase (Old Yellow Enzyme family)
MPYDVRVAELFKPMRLRSLTLRNRFAMAPMTRRASPGGIPGADVAEYYARRAAGGVGLIITEGIRLAEPEAGWPSGIPTLVGDDALAGWRAVTRAVHGHGGAIAAQLWHQGAERSAVELHGAHGYLIDEFLWARTNLRTDGYGGDLSARARFPAEVVAAVRAAVGQEFPIIFRFSQWKQTDYAASVADDPADLQELLAPLVDAGVDMFHPSTRRHHESAYPDADLELSLSGWTKKVTGAPVIAVGSVGLETEFTPGRPGGHIPPAPVDRLLDQYGSGEFDVVAIGRALLADPTWVNRLRDGSLDGFNGYDAETALAQLS